MNYAIKILEDEHRILSMALKDSKAWDNHPEAYKDRMNKLSQIRKAMNRITIDAKEVIKPNNEK